MYIDVIILGMHAQKPHKNPGCIMRALSLCQLIATSVNVYTVVELLLNSVSKENQSMMAKNNFERIFYKIPTTNHSLNKTFY